MPETNDQREQRIAKLAQLREKGIDPYPARVHYKHTTAQAVAAFEAAPAEAEVVAQVVGRLVAVRVMGKSTFAHIADGWGRLQVYLRQDIVGAEVYDLFRKEIDIADFIAVEGRLFRTRTGEVTVHVDTYSLLAKALRKDRRARKLAVDAKQVRYDG